MSNFIIVSGASNCSFRDLLNTGKSLLTSSICPSHWLISGSSIQLSKIQNHRLLRKSNIIITDDFTLPATTSQSSTIVFLRAGDMLAQDALSLISQHTAKHDIVYGDSEHGRASRFDEPSKVRRPQWSPERLRSHNYVGDLLVASQSVVAAAGGISTLATLHEHDRSLRLFDACSTPLRIAEVLYHSTQERMTPTASLEAVQQHCVRSGIDATCSIDQGIQSVRISRRLRSQPKISVIVPTRGTTETIKGKQVVLAAHTIETLIANSTYQNFDVIAVLDSDTPSEGRQAVITAGGNRLKIVD